MSQPDDSLSQSKQAHPTHFNDKGEAHMVDVTNKLASARQAIATSKIRMCEPAAKIVRDGGGHKGDVLGIARIAGITATKWTSNLIPLCHGIPIEAVEIAFDWVDEATGLAQPTNTQPTLVCTATVRTTYKTGVEMEALMAASVAALTVYDMLKAIDKSMTILETRLESKTGGKSGPFVRKDVASERGSG